MSAVAAGEIPALLPGVSAGLMATSEWRQNSRKLVLLAKKLSSHLSFLQFGFCMD